MNTMFYEFSSKFSPSTFQARPEGLNTHYSNPPASDETRIYDQDLLLHGNYTNVKLPVVFTQQYGKVLKDIIGTGWASLYLISDKMKNVLQDAHLTGWRTFDIILLDKKGERIEGYEGLSIVGRCGEIDYNKSEIIEKQVIDHGPLVKFYKGIYFDLHRWDGSDFFLAKGNTTPIVTANAEAAIKQNNLTNIALRSLSDIEVDDFTVKVALKNRGTG